MSTEAAETSPSDSRTLIASVLFIDIAGYSRFGVTEQIRLKQNFNQVLSAALQDTEARERVVVDTGDGAAVAFLGSPERALFAALAVFDTVGELPVRMGINMGPVHVSRDINGQENVIGDGINVAQRIMSFAEPGQILVSRSYYDVMARLSEDYAKLFHYEGAKTDKHVREHEVYAISTNTGGLRRTVPIPPPKQTMRLPTLSMPPFLKVNPRHWPEVLAVNSKLFVVAPLAFTLIVGTGVIARSHRDDDARPASPPVAQVAIARRGCRRQRGCQRE